VLVDVEERDEREYGTFSDDDIAGLRSEASQREITRSNPRFIEEHEKPFHLPWFTKIMIAIAVMGFLTVGTLLLTAFFSGHLGMMSVTRGDLAKIASMSGVPGVKHSKLLKAALNGNKGAADMSIYGTRTPKGMKTIFSGNHGNGGGFINYKKIAHVGAGGIPDIAGGSLAR